MPLVQEGGRWYFDAAAGRGEIVARRIGRNELSAIAVSRAYVAAQDEYALAHTVQGVPHYALKLMSSPGQQDGLYWVSADSATACSLPADLARAVEAMREDPGDAYHGYYFRILTGQGPSAHGGAASYLADGALIGGFALIAWPSDYGVSGVQTFMVAHDGVVVQKDLGPQTATLVPAITAYDPDASWERVPSEP